MTKLPLTLLAAQKFAQLLARGNSLQSEVALLAEAANTSIPAIASSQVVLSSVTPDMGDKNVQLTYPRVCLYSTGLKNTQHEKFRTVSGNVSVVAEVWASGNMITQTDEWIHFYVEAVADILRTNVGDWGDGVFFSGVYDIQFQQAKSGGLGFIQSAKVTCSLNVSRN